MTELKPGLCVLITNAFIRGWSGSELYIRDVAMELIKRGYKPVVYSPRIGPLAEQFRMKSIPVVSDLNSLDVKPDLIHGQHHMETMTALAHFPGTPAVFFCHGWLPWEETPPVHPRILRYVTVSNALNDRLVYECGIPAEKVTTVLNSVDLERFRPRPPLPTHPKRALIFHHRAMEANLLGIVKEACNRNGMDVVDAIGYATGNASQSPEALLGEYDIIFAVGRSALEGLAVGTAVICCGLEGAGPMVSIQNLPWLRNNNFGIRILDRPLTAEILSAEIKQYNPLDAENVSREVRATAGLAGMVDQVLGVYAATLDGWPTNSPPDPRAESLAFSTYLEGISDKFDQAEAESALANERARLLQGELGNVRAELIKATDELGNARAELVKATTELDNVRFGFDKVSGELGNARAELENIKARLTWRLYYRLSHISFVRNLYGMLAVPIRRWRAHTKDERK